MLSSLAEGGMDANVAAENVDERTAEVPVDKTFAVPPKAIYGGGT